jgi:hypothetical protein
MAFLMLSMVRKYYDFDDWLSSLTEQQQTLALTLQSIILSAGDGISQTMRFNLPFFDYYGWMVYLNRYKKGIDLGFIQGVHLSAGDGRLEVRKRKQIRSLHVEVLSDIHPQEVMQLIFDAMEFNRTVNSKKAFKKR